MRRVRPNTLVRIHRVSGRGSSGSDSYVVQVPRAWVRMSFRRDHLVSGDGTLDAISGTMDLDSHFDVKQGDLVQILEGHRESSHHRYQIESVEPILNATGRHTRTTCAISMDRSRGAAS